MLCEETKTAAAETSMSRAAPAMTSFICRDLGALMESNNSMITSSRANQVNCDPSTLVPVSRLSKMQICPVLTLAGPVRRTKKATGKRVTHCSYDDCLQSPCKHDRPRLGFIMQSQDKLSYLGKASQSSSNKKPIRLEWHFFLLKWPISYRRYIVLSRCCIYRARHFTSTGDCVCYR